MDVSYIKKLAQTQKWRRGSTWEFDMYIVEMFVNAMAHNIAPIEINYIQPVLDDEFLNTSLNDDLLARFKDFYESKNAVATLLKKQESVVESGSSLLEKMKNQVGVFDFTEYHRVQSELSLLMASVSVVFDPLMTSYVHRLGAEFNADENVIGKYLIQVSSVTALNKSNQLLLEYYNSNKEEFDGHFDSGTELSAVVKCLLQEHVKMFDWLNTGEKGRKPWSTEDFLRQLQELRYTDTPDEIELPHDLVRALQPLISINVNDNNAADIQIELDYYFQKYLQDVLRENYDEQIIEKLTLSELKDVVGGQVGLDAFANRENLHSLVFADAGSTHVIWFGEQTYNEIRSLIIIDVYDETNIKLIGRPASSGIVEGIARIVRSQKDLEDFPNGHILVAEKTQPSYILAMRKAIAIVTDIGGITSHAAIVSRELNTPCVVATGNATHTIRNGDKIRVNAHDGVIEILERASVTA